MASLYIPRSFAKKAAKFKVNISELLSEVRRFVNGAENLVDLYSPGRDLKVLKAYLSQRKVRAALLLRVSKEIYVPFYLAKKETAGGWNLSKYSAEDLLEKIKKSHREIADGHFETFDL